MPEEIPAYPILEKSKIYRKMPRCGGRSCTFHFFSLGVLDSRLGFHLVSVRSSSLCKLCTMSVLLFFLKGLCPEADSGKHAYPHVLLASPIPGALISPPALMICPCSWPELALSPRIDRQVLFKSAFVLVDPYLLN